MFTKENTADATHVAMTESKTFPHQFYKAITNIDYEYLNNFTHRWVGSLGDTCHDGLIKLSRPHGHRKCDFEWVNPGVRIVSRPEYQQDHHIALQIEALGEPGSPVEFVETETEYSDFDAALNALSAELGVPVAELIGDPCKPVYTQAMKDMGELPMIGSDVIYNTASRGDIIDTVTGFRTFKSLNTLSDNCDYRVFIKFEHNERLMSDIKPIDTRTDEEKLNNAIFSEIEGDCGVYDAPGLIKHLIKHLLASDKFTITLNEQ